MAQKVVDAKGLPCPQPLVLTKKSLKELNDGEQMIVLVDNETAKANVERFLRGNHVQVTSTEENGGYSLTVTKKQDSLPHGDTQTYGAAAQALHHVVAIQSDKMGEGPEELGLLLMKGFLSTIKEVKPLPKAIVFYTRGIFLTLNDSPVLETLQELERLGVFILVCGTCVDYFQKKDLVRTGAISNMYTILETLTEADRIITP